MQENTGLLPCPFCGKEKPSIYQAGGYWKIKCVDGCSLSISGYMNKKGALEAWNRRPAEEVCTWSPDDESELWHGSCGAELVFDESTPYENEFKFCPVCGRTLVQFVPENGQP